MVMKNIYKSAEHPFAQYVRIVGKGRSGSRSLSFEEARAAMGHILRGEVLDVQLGAFMMLLRVKEETSDELAGFVAAAREHIAAPQDIAVDLDWSSYAGKRKHYPWFLFAIKLLAQHGVRIFIHGAGGHTLNRLYTENVLPVFGIPECRDWDEVRRELDSRNIAYMPLSTLSPPLADIIDLRNVMGLRSPVHTLARLLNPLNATHGLQAIFHPAYRESHQQAAYRLGYRNVFVIKGEGGEIERNPDGLCLVQGILNGELMSEEWPVIYPERHRAEEAFDLEHYRAVWRGSFQHEYADGAVIGTLALALRLLGRAPDQTAALALATDWWQARNRSSL